MNADEALLAVVDALERLDIPYLITGSLAANFHGIPRSTRDADVVVDLAPGALTQLADALPRALRIDPQASFETITGTTRHVLRLHGSPFVVELFLLSQDDHDVCRFQRRLRVSALGRALWVPRVEDVVITKLRWSLGRRSSQDFEDVRNVIAVSGDQIDWDEVLRWCARHGTLDALAQVRASLL